MQDRNLTDGEAVFLESDPPDSVFVVLQGYIIIAANSTAGAHHGQALGAGSVFGVIADWGHVTAHGISVVRIYSAEEARFAAAARMNQVDLLMAAILNAGGGRIIRNVAASTTAPLQDEEAEDDTAENLSKDSPEEWAPVRLIVTEPEIIEHMEYPELDIELFPFVVGREDGKSVNQSVDLPIPDDAPFQLSRRHFMIEDGDEGFEIVDCGSYHGTIVNGAKLGNDGIHFRAPLNPGENQIIAGTPSSPFRFVIVIEGDDAP